MSSSKPGRRSILGLPASRVLPARPHLEHLKQQAKELLRAARAGEAGALQRLSSVARPPTARPSDYRLTSLASAQHVIAQDYGFATWALLRAEVLRRRAELLEAEGLPEDREQRMDLLDDAIRERSYAAMRVLLEADRSLAVGWVERRPLGLAVELELPKAIDLLLDAGAELEPESPYPHTHFSWAITNGWLRAARRLLERGAPIDLWSASGLGDLERMKTFFDADGKPVPRASRYGATRWDPYPVQLPKPPTDAIEIVSDALYIACRNGQLEAARFLLDRGANPAFVAYGAPALHWAAYSGNQPLVALLLDRGADPLQGGGQYGSAYREFAVRTPLLWAQPAALARVIRADPSLVHEQSERFGPALHAAAELGLDEHVKLLLEAGADPEALDFAGRTALDCARNAESSDAAARVLALLEAAVTC